MAYYYKLGEIPPKRHTQFRQPDGSLYKEELVSSRGFSGIYSNLYHVYAPTKIKEVLASEEFKVKAVKDYSLKQTHLNTSKIGFTGNDFLRGRKMLFTNKDVTFGLGRGIDMIKVRVNTRKAS